MKHASLSKERVRPWETQQSDWEREIQDLFQPSEKNDLLELPEESGLRHTPKMRGMCWRGH